MSHLIIPPGARREADFNSGGLWTLYRLPYDPRASFLWPAFKLMRPPETRARWGEPRTYPLAWNPLRERFRKDARRLHLERHHPAMFMQLELHMSLHFPPAWLTDPDGGGYSPDEVAAELARLKEARAARRART